VRQLEIKVLNNIDAWCNHEVCPDSCSLAPPCSVTLSCQLRIWHL